MKHLVTGAAGFIGSNIFKAEDLSFVGTDLEEGEYIEVVPKSREELKELYKNGKIKDSKTLIAVMYYLGDF